MSRLSTMLFIALAAVILFAAPQLSNAQLGGCTASAPSAAYSVAVTFVVVGGQLSDTFGSDLVSASVKTLESSFGSGVTLGTAISCGAADDYTFSDPSLNFRYGYAYKTSLFIDAGAVKGSSNGADQTALTVAGQFLQLLRSNAALSSSIVDSPLQILTDSLTLSYVN